MRRTVALLALPIAVACSSKPSGTIVLLDDPDDQPLTRAPAPTTLKVEAIDTAGNATTLATAKLPASSVDLGDVDESTTGYLRVSALDDNGAALARGSSLSVQLGALESASLDIFIQRIGGSARLPSPLGDARSSPVAVMLGARYVLVGGGDDATLASQAQVYDLASFAAASAPPKLPRAPKSMAAVGTVALLIDDAGATWFDFSDSSSADATAPRGGSFGEVAGGATIVASDGTVFVVGPTRTSGDATARVLKIDGQGNLAWLSLITARKGAAATWTASKGLAVIGGSASGAGVEIVAPGAASASAVPFPSDAAVGAGAAPLDQTHAIVAGGLDASGADAKVRVIDLGCSSSCAPTVWPATLATPLVAATSFALDSANAVVVGDDATGATHVFRLATMVASEIPLRTPRKHARALALPTGVIGLVGGDASIESYLP